MLCFVYVLGKSDAGEFLFTDGMVFCEGFLVVVSHQSKAAAPLTG